MRAGGAAGKSVFSVRGESLLRPCLPCKNVAALRDCPSLAEHDPSGYSVPLACADPQRFDHVTDTDLLHSSNALSQVKCASVTKAVFDLQWKKARGHQFMSPIPPSRQRSARLLPPSRDAREPMHTMLESAVVSAGFTTCAACCGNQHPGLHSRCSGNGSGAIGL